MLCFNPPLHLFRRVRGGETVSNKANKIAVEGGFNIEKLEFMFMVPVVLSSIIKLIVVNELIRFSR